MRSPVSDYTCPDLLAQEQQVLFRDTPLMMGLSSDIPPGHYWADSKTGIPLLMVRDTEGTFRAFANICRHRGAQVVPDGRGQRDRLSCPFHAWTYNLKGELIAINREVKFGCIEKSEHGLIELPSAEKYGTLWVKPSQGGTIDVDDCLGGLEEDFESWKLDMHPYAKEQEIEAPINWKLAIDTFGENYHFDVLHRNTLAPAIRSNLQTHDIFGMNYRMVFANQTFTDIWDYTETHNHPKPFRAMTLCVYFVYPNTIVLVDGGGVDVLRIFPAGDSPNASITTQRWYLSPDAAIHWLGHVNEIEERFVGFNAIIQEEDFKVAADAQRNAQTGLLDHIVFGRNEPALHHYHNSHRRGMNRPLLQLETA